MPKTPGNARPRHGPMARSWQDPQTGRWRVALTDAGRAFCEDQLRRYPDRLGLARRVVPRMIETCRAIGMSWDEIASLAADALVTAIVHWDPERTFPAILAACVRSALGDHLRYHFRGMRRGLVRVPMSDHLADRHDAGRGIEVRDAYEPVRRALDALDEDDRAILTGRFLDDTPLTDLAARRGEHKATTHFRVRRGLGRLRDRLADPADLRSVRDHVLALDWQSSRRISARRVSHATGVRFGRVAAALATLAAEGVIILSDGATHVRYRRAPRAPGSRAAISEPDL